jgi:preprotein translocase subunit YajC
MNIFTSVMDFFVAPSQAAPVGGAQPQGANFSLLIIMLVFVFFMYMTVWRPQSKRAKEHRDLLNSLAKGDEVVTAGGIVGKVNKLADSYVVVTVSENVDITVQKSSISTVLPKGTLKAI